METATMIDNELDQLSRALIAATDRLNSQDFQDRQARYVALEQEVRELGEELEAEEHAVERAQAALTRHIQANYLEGSHLTVEEPQHSDDALFETDFEITPLPNEEDEYQSARAAGAYTEN
jgi:small-conductance mechanosensitive channel